MTKNILFLVTGMTPAVVTETVWALSCDPNNEDLWIPDEIHVLSTGDGLNQIQATLMNDGIFATLQEQYPALKNTIFNHQCLHVFIDKHGNPLSDLKTPEDNELAADMICQKIREFTENDDVVLHVSIAGGRKTMGFYAGYALSLYGRAQDRMSHVLVEDQFEAAKGFYYPTPTDHFVENKFTGKKLNAKDAQVWLAQIPFVRMRASLKPNDMLINKSFSQVVATLNLALQPITVHLNTLKRQVVINDQVCKLTPKEFTLYYLIAELTQRGLTVRYPSKDIEGDCIDEALQERFNRIYGNYKAKDDVVVDFDYFSTALSTMKKKFKEQFGQEICDQICIQPVGPGYALKLPAAQIQIR